MKPSVKLWYWIPDTTPCKVTYHTVLPNGISYNANSINVYAMANVTGIMKLVDANNYTILVNGNDISVTINDVKQSCYYTAAINPIIVTFSGNVMENAANINQMNASLTYNYGKGDKIATMNSVIVRKKYFFKESKKRICAEKVQILFVFNFFPRIHQRSICEGYFCKKFINRDRDMMKVE